MARLAKGVEEVREKMLEVREKILEVREKILVVLKRSMLEVWKKETEALKKTVVKVLKALKSLNVRHILQVSILVSPAAFLTENQLLGIQILHKDRQAETLKLMKAVRSTFAMKASIMAHAEPLRSFRSSPWGQEEGRMSRV